MRRCAVSLGDLAEGCAALPAQRKERNKNDIVAGAVVDDLFVPSLGKVVLVLDRSDGDDSPGTLDLRDCDLRDPDMTDLAAVPILLDRAEALLERGLRVDAVQVIESDAVGSQPAKALLDFSPQHLRAAASGAADPAFRGNNATFGNGRQSGSDRLF